MLIYGIKKLKLAGLRLERFDPEYSPLIHYLVDLMLIISPEILEDGTLDPPNEKGTHSAHQMLCAK